jgi:glucose-6-phosphate isomerase
MLANDHLLSRFDPAAGRIIGEPRVERHLSDLRECFADRSALDLALKKGDPLVYSVSSFTPADGEGDLHYGIGLIMPGKIGFEYFMTKGHVHAWRDAAEIYIGLAGEGMMLLEEVSTKESRMIELRPNTVVYVPGGTAHRTVNVGSTPLTYLGVYPARAGHDYDAIARENFSCLIAERNGRPAMIERKQFRPVKP